MAQQVLPPTPSGRVINERGEMAPGLFAWMRAVTQKLGGAGVVLADEVVTTGTADRAPLSPAPRHVIQAAPQRAQMRHDPRPASAGRAAPCLARPAPLR